jgi:trk system potassium uptake protein TrkA
MKIIIAGAGNVGTYLAKMLSEGNHDLIVIDLDEKKLSNIRSHFDVLTVNGSATSIQTLKDANIAKTDLFIGVTELEEINITAAILSKKLGAKKTIARINNQEYLIPANRSFFLNLGIDSMIYPEILASKEIINLVKQAGTSKTYDFSGGSLSLFALKLDPEAPIVNKTLKQVTDDVGGLFFRAVAITRNSVTIIPHGDDTFFVGDMVYVITTKSGVDKLMYLTGKQTFTMRNIMILGGSRIGIKTAKRLEQHFNIKLIEIDSEKCFALADELEKTLVINGDGRDIDLLIEEGIHDTDAFIAVTGNSEINILSCLIAKRHGVKRAIAEIENMDYIDMADNMGIDAFVNKRMIAASNIYSFTLEAEVSSMQCLTATEAEIFEFVAHRESKITQAPLRELNFPQGAIIGGLIRGSKAHIAVGDTLIQQGDKVVVFALPFAIDKVVSFFH